MNADKCMTQARARIIWGEASSSVREFMVSNGISVAVADAELGEFEAERSRELRRIGLGNVLIGIVLTGAAGFTLYLALPIASALSGTIGALAIVLLAGVYGLSKLVKGITYLVRPQSEHKSIPDIEQSDLIE
jgi:hypothetical protein